MSEFKSCSSCTRENNNANFNCPVKGDYRLFTDWRPRCSTQYADMIQGQLPSAMDYRMYLTHNAEDLIKRNAFKAYLKAACGPCVQNPSWDDGTMLPEFESQQCNSRTCSFRPKDPWGLGRERKYFDDDMEKEMKKEFIALKEKENEFFKQTAQCCTSVSDDMAYFPIDGGVQQNYSRFAVPSGGALMRGGDHLKTSQ